MKRIELGRLSDGKYGLRVSRPGFDVTHPDAPLVFDSEVYPAAVIFKGSMVAETVTRSVVSNQLPGFPGTTTTTLRSTATFNFPFSLPFVPFVRTLKRFRVEDETYFGDETQHSRSAYVTNSSVLSSTSEQFSGNVAYEYAPIHYFIVLNIPQR